MTTYRFISAITVIIADIKQNDKSRLDEECAILMPMATKGRTQTAAWISIADELPDKGVLVLASVAPPGEAPSVCSAYHDDDGWKTEAGDADGNSYDLDHVTHWMAYPDPAQSTSQQVQNKKK